MFGLEPGTLAQWFGGTATFLAVLVALFKEQILRFWRKPKLKVSIVLSPPDCHQTRVSRRVEPRVSADCYYLRLWVENCGKTRAEIIQVFVAKLLRKSADGQFREVEDFLPMNLKWAHGGEVFAPGISPTMGKHCDLGHLIDPQAREQFGDDLEGVPDAQTILSLDLEFPPPTKSHLIPPGTYQLQLKIAASNCAVVNKTLELTITGSWFPDEKRMFRDGLGVG
jgi:hypothetical protein